MDSLNTIIVEVYFPSLGKSFDIEIPITLRFHQITDLIEQTVCRITGGQYAPSGEAVLCDRESGIIYDINFSPDQQCLINGSRLLLI